jgi:signal transduction histidine kinase
VVLEAIQDGANVDLQIEEEELPVVVVSTAIRAALANLMENAADASPAGSPIAVTIHSSGSDGVVSIADRGPGLSEEVRKRLYEPHVTTKVGGSGMGLFLAQQLVVGMHGGGLDVHDREDGGTMSIVRLPLARSRGNGEEQ